LPIFGDDPFTTEKDGFEHGEIISFKLFNPSTNEQLDLIPQFDQSLPVVNGRYVDDGLSAIAGFSVETQGRVSLLNRSNHISIYPNPTRGKFIIQGIDDSASIEIFNYQWQCIRAEVDNTDALATINLSGAKPGIYIIKISFGGQTIYRKLILH